MIKVNKGNLQLEGDPITLLAEAGLAVSEVIIAMIKDGAPRDHIIDSFISSVNSAIDRNLAVKKPDTTTHSVRSLMNKIEKE